MSDAHQTNATLRRLGVAGWILVVLSALIGLVSAVTSTSTVAPSSSYSEWMFLIVPTAFGFGFVLAPLLAYALEKESMHEWSKYIWVMAGLAPLSMLLTAFFTSMAARSPDWSYLVNAGCPLGISVALAFRHNPMESTRNLL